MQKGWLPFHRARAVSSDDGIAGVFNKTFIGELPGVTALAGMVPLRVWDSVVNEIQRALIWRGLLVLERQVTRYYVWGWGGGVAGAAPLAAAAPAVRGLAGITGGKNGRPANLIPRDGSRMPN